jgi:predicted HTH domain antitoxin
MQSTNDHYEAALYWSAVSLLVCEGISIEHAARRLGLAADQLREILERRQERLAPLPYPPTRPISCATSGF